MIYKIDIAPRYRLVAQCGRIEIFLGSRRITGLRRCAVLAGFGVYGKPADDKRENTDEPYSPLTIEGDDDGKGSKERR